jgi:hypothetical protein
MLQTSHLKDKPGLFPTDPTLETMLNLHRNGDEIRLGVRPLPVGCSTRKCTR